MLKELDRVLTMAAMLSDDEDEDSFCEISYFIESSVIPDSVVMTMGRLFDFSVAE